MRIHRRAYCSYIEHYYLDLDEALAHDVNVRLKDELITDEPVSLTLEEICYIVNEDYDYDEKGKYNIKRKFRYRWNEETTYEYSIQEWLQDLINDWVWNTEFESEYIQCDDWDDSIEDNKD